MALNESLDKQVRQRVDTYRNNPQALQQRQEENKQFLNLMALQQVKFDQEAARRTLELAQQNKPDTIAKQYAQETVGAARKAIGDKLKGVSGVLQQQQAAQQNNLQRAAQGAVPPPQAAAQGAVPPPQVANAGIAAAPRPTMRMAQGGVVGFQRGGGASGNMPVGNYPGGRLNPREPSKYGLQDLLRDVRTDDETAAAMAANMSLEEFRRQPPEIQAQYLKQIQHRERAVQAKVPGGSIPAAPDQSSVRPAQHPLPARLPRPPTAPGQPLPSAFGEAPESQAEFMVPGIPDPGPAQDKPVAAQRTNAITAAATAPAGGVTHDPQIKQALLAATRNAQRGGEGPSGRYDPQGRQFQKSGIAGEVLDKARGLATIDPQKAYTDTRTQALEALGRPAAARAAESRRQREYAAKIAARDDPAKQQREQLFRQLEETSRTGTLGGGAAGAGALKAGQEAAELKGLAGLHAMERADEALDTTVRKEAFTAAREAMKEAGINVAKGITAMAGLSRDEQNRLSDEAKAQMESGDRREKMKLDAVMRLSSDDTRIKVANLAADTAKQDRVLEAAVESSKNRRMEINDIQKLISDNVELMTKTKIKLEEIQKEDGYKLVPPYSTMGPKEKVEYEKQWRINNAAVLASIIAGIPERDRDLKAQLLAAKRGGLQAVEPR